MTIWPDCHTKYLDEQGRVSIFLLLKEFIFGYVHSTQIEDHFRAKATKLLIRILGVELMQFYDHV